MGKSRDIADGTRYVDASGDTMTGPLKHLHASTSGALVLGSGDDSVGSSNRAQIKLGYDSTESYPSYISSRHNGSLAPNNAIDFHIGNGTATGGVGVATTLVMSLDGTGAVQKPNHPAFVAYNAPAYLTNNTTLVWGSTALNRGSVYNTSNGRFTAPAAGLYQFFASVRIETAEPAATYHRLAFVLNGTDITWSKSRLNSRTATGYYSHAASDQIIGCQAGDYVNVKFESGGVAQFTAASNLEHVFYGYLVG